MATDEGHSDSAIARELKVNRKTVRLWRTRVRQQGVAAVWETAPGRGRKPFYTPARIQSVVETARPTGPSVPWTCRQLAARFGMSTSTIHRILRDHIPTPDRNGENPSLRKRASAEDFMAVVGLYVNTPGKAIVFCISERTPLPALTSGTSKAAPLIPDLALLVCSVMGQAHPSRREEGFVRFLRSLERSVVDGCRLHMIVENVAERNPSRWQRWLTRYRVEIHGVPRGCNWLDFVDSCLANMCDEDLICDGAGALNQAIWEFLDSASSKPFVWTRNAKSLLGGSEDSPYD